jgi:hypothetical protein
MTKTYKIISKEPYTFIAKTSGNECNKFRYKTDSDVLEIFDNLEIGRSYIFEQVVAIDKATGAEMKRQNGSPVYNYNLVDIVENNINYDKPELQLQLDEIFKKLELIDKGIVEILDKLSTLQDNQGRL